MTTTTYTQSAVLMADLSAYVIAGRPLSGFLKAVVCNDLMGAVMIADEHSLALLPSLVAYLCNEAPQACWGKPCRYTLWVDEDSG